MCARFRYQVSRYLKKWNLRRQNLTILCEWGDPFPFSRKMIIETTWVKAYYFVNLINNSRLNFPRKSWLNGSVATMIAYVIIERILETLRNVISCDRDNVIRENRKLRASSLVWQVFYFGEAIWRKRVLSVKSCEKIKLAAAYFDNELDCFFFCELLFVRNSNDFVFFFTRSSFI